jgi:hypothetical protein
MYNGHDAEYDSFICRATTCIKLAMRDGIAEVGKGHAKLGGCRGDEATSEEGMEG